MGLTHAIMVSGDQAETVGEPTIADLERAKEHHLFSDPFIVVNRGDGSRDRLILKKRSGRILELASSVEQARQISLEVGPKVSSGNRLAPCSNKATFLLSLCVVRSDGSRTEPYLQRVLLHNLEHEGYGYWNSSMKTIASSTCTAYYEFLCDKLDDAIRKMK